MKVCHLSSVHAKDDVRIFHKECVSLAAAGYDVTFVVPATSAPEKVKGVKICSLPPAANRLARMLSMPWRVFLSGLRVQADVYHFHDPELIPVGCLMKVLGRRVVYDVHEDVPADILMKEYLPRTLRGVIAAFANLVERAGATLFDRIVTATPAIARRFPVAKTTPVQNYPILGELAALQSGSYDQRPKVVAYIGAITPERGLLEMVKAMALIKPEFGARLLLAGGVDEKFARLLRSEPGWAYVDYKGTLSRAALGDALGLARAGLVLFHSGPNHDEAQPNKLFEYMSASLPLIASHFPLWRQLVEGERCGMVVDPTDPAAIARAIETILGNPAEAAAMGERGLNATKTRYNWAAESRKLLDVYRGFACAE